jgi:hypothetical protein
VSDGPNVIGIVVKFDDFQITKFALARSSAWLPADANLMDLASLQVILAPGAKLPANAKAVKHKTDTAVMSASASLFIIHSSLTLVKHSVYKLSSGAVKPASPPNSSNESLKSQKNKTKPFPNIDVGQTLHHVIPQINKDFPHNLLTLIVTNPHQINVNNSIHLIVDHFFNP